MTPEHDPYRAPSARVIDFSRTRRIRIEGKALVVPQNASLPEVCIRTGQPLSGPGTRQYRTLKWTPPWTMLFIFLHILVMFLVMRIFRQTTDITYTITPKLHRNWQWQRRFCYALVILGILGPFFPRDPNVMGLVLLGSWSAVLVGYILLRTWARGVWIAKLDGAEVHLRGLTLAGMDAIIASVEAKEAAEGDWRDQLFPAEPRKAPAGSMDWLTTVFPGPNGRIEPKVDA
jgi:hypothetical protein